ncbi:MAG TPA: Na+/H+ antiporter NhaA [Solirubrobacteraceae bacterium]|jgi:Na+/H+ antiporter NhaA|nr:Na+/H+ antiporter NhaA [Solirubrobacteraceae bacterium]
MADSSAVSDDAADAERPRAFSERTAWARNLAAPVRSFLSTETGSAGLLVAAAIAALVWANSPWSSSYESVWTTTLSIKLGSAGVTTDLRHWINEGLMTFFFLVVGLEAKREFDLGELRERSRLAIPVVAAIGGAGLAVAIYLVFNAGRSSAHGWGAAMSTDTALSLGALALLTPRAATRLRVFLLTLAVVDDLIGLVVIVVVYTSHVSVPALGAAGGLFATFFALRYAPLAVRRQVAIAVGVALWVAMFKSGIDPVVAGLAVGLAITAYTPAREDLERATEVTRSFREQPTPELARSAQLSVLGAISLNDRLQYTLHPWTSYVIVPLFALANAGVHVSGGLLEDAISSPITLGILLGYVVGKPLGIIGASWLASRPALGGRRPSLTWPALASGGAIAGIGFTVSLLISSLAFHGRDLQEAQLGVIATTIVAPLVASGLFAVYRRLPTQLLARQIGGTPADVLDLTEEVDPERDHIRGPDDAPVTLVEYGDFQCPYCGQAEPVIRDLLSSFGGDLRYVWRHLPLNDVHSNAQLASEASEAAASQGRFWDMYDALLNSQDELTPKHLTEIATDLGLDVERFRDELRQRKFAERVSEDVASADSSGVSGTPTFFINGRRHYGAYDIDTLTEEVRAALRRAKQLASSRPTEPAAA